MSTATPQDLVIAVSAPDQLFNAPAVNPFSENALEILGVSGLAYIVRQLQGHRRGPAITCIRVRIPPDQITPEFERRLADAMHAYCRAKIEDNTLEIHLIRVRSSIGLGILLGIVAVLIAVAYFLLTGPFAGAPQVIQLVVVTTISLFAWVSLWDPLEALLFNPIALIRENIILRQVSEMAVVVEPDTPASTPDATGRIQSPSDGVPASTGS